MMDPTLRTALRIMICLFVIYIARRVTAARTHSEECFSWHDQATLLWTDSKLGMLQALTTQSQW